MRELRNLSGATAALDDAAGRLSELFLAQALMNIGFGAVVGASLWMIGVPNSLLWGGLAILMRFVPYVGSFIAAIPPILLAVAVDPGWGMAIAVLVIFLIGEPLMGHVIEPLLLGPKAGLSPFAMLASAAFWALVWGPIGLILAAPLTLTMIVVGRHVNGLKFMTVLLGDEPALSPEQQFYHRLLASDALGAAQQLEKASVDKSLIEIGDGIVLPALHLAAADFDRHQFDREQAQSILDTSIETSRLFEPARTDGEVQSHLAHRLPRWPAGCQHSAGPCPHAAGYRSSRVHRPRARGSSATHSHRDRQECGPYCDKPGRG